MSFKLTLMLYNALVINNFNRSPFCRISNCHIGIIHRDFSVEATAVQDEAVYSCGSLPMT